MSTGADKLVIVLWSAGPDAPNGAALAAAPFVYALAARALEVDVDMHFTSTTVRWLLPGVADTAPTDAEARAVDTFTDVRDHQRRLKSRGLSLMSEADPHSTGPASLMLTDPDGNTILIDQHV